MFDTCYIWTVGIDADVVVGFFTFRFILINLCLGHKCLVCNVSPGLCVQRGQTNTNRTTSGHFPNNRHYTPGNMFCQGIEASDLR